MDVEKAISTADDFLNKKRIGHCEPITSARTSDGDFVITFTVPEALQPDVVVDPPDVRVLVRASTFEAELLPDM